MVDYIPQDEYFEWEDILEFRQHDHFADVKEKGYTISTSECAEPFTQPLSFLKRSEDELFCWGGSEINTGGQLEVAAPRSFSTFTSAAPIRVPDSAKPVTPIDISSHDKQPKESVRLQEPVQQCKQIAKDDSDAYLHPSRCVDYFAHDWSQEDMSTSWRHIRKREKSCKNAERLENASWRSWAKMCFGLKTVSPATVNWLKDLDDICLYGPFHATPSEDEAVFACDEISKPILKRPSISQLLLQGSHLSWTGSRRRSSDGRRKSSIKRSVKFDHIIEQCIIIEAAPHKSLPKSKGVGCKSSASPTISSEPTLMQEQVYEKINKPSFWSSPVSSLPEISSVATPPNFSQWTWLSASEEDEVDWISPQPNSCPEAYRPSLPSPSSIVRDHAAKAHYIPKRQQDELHTREQNFSDEEDEDEMMAQFLFDCDFKSDSDNLSPSESSSSSEDQDEDDVEFFDSGDLADERRLMDELHEISMRETTKQTLFEQVVDEVNLGWE